MWCPDGYLRFIEVLGGEEFAVCSTLFIEKRGKEWMMDRSKATERFPQIAALVEKDGDLSFIIGDVFRRWAFIMLLPTRYMPIHLCSMQGVVLRCDFPIGVAMPKEKENCWSEFDPYSADADAYIDMFQIDLDLEYFGVDLSTGIVKLPPIKYGSKFRRFDTSTVLHDSRNFWSYETEAVKELVWRKMALFEGWSVCFRKDPYLDSGQSIYDALLSIPHVQDLAQATVDERQLLQSKGGRPSLRRTAAAQFNLKYPKGFAEVNLSEAARSLGYDRKTLRRALIEEGVIGSSPED